MLIGRSKHCGLMNGRIYTFTPLERESEVTGIKPAACNVLQNAKPQGRFSQAVPATTWELLQGSWVILNPPALLNSAGMTNITDIDLCKDIDYVFEFSVTINSGPQAGRQDSVMSQLAISPLQ